MTVEGAELWAYHLRHAWGGFALTCDLCGHTYALAGRVDGGLEHAEALPSVVDLALVEGRRFVALTRLQCRLLDTALMVEDVLWAESVMQVRRGELGEEETPGARMLAARLMRRRLQWEKLQHLEAIREDLGLDEWPAGARIFRAAGGGYVDLGEAAPPVADGAELLEEILVAHEVANGARA